MFVTPDSIVPDLFDPQDLNRYAYCRNNPLIYTDPSGHIPSGQTDSAAGDIKEYAKEKHIEAEKHYSEIEPGLLLDQQRKIESEFPEAIVALANKLQQSKIYKGFAQVNINKIQEACKKAFQSIDNKKACNFFVSEVAKDVGIPLEGLANEMAKEIQKDWNLAKDAIDAVNKAQEGNFVVGFYENPKGTGHITVIDPKIRADGVPYGSWGALNQPQKAQLNGPITQSFGSRLKDVKYGYTQIPVK